MKYNNNNDDNNNNNNKGLMPPQHRLARQFSSCKHPLFNICSK